MKLGNKRVLSLFIALFMLFSAFGNFTPKAFAAQNDLKSKEEVMQIFAENFKIPSEVIEGFKNESENQTFTGKGTGIANRENDIINDNLPQDSQEIDLNKEVRLIVELEGKAVKDIATKSQLMSYANDENIVNEILRTQESTIESLKQVDTSITVRRRYSTLLNGFSIDAKYGDIEEILALPNVKNVSVANIYYPDMTNAKGMTTNLQKVWEELGYKGEGMVVSIIDTGIDYNHKDMVLSATTTSSALTRGNVDTTLPGKYFTKKVPYGYNYADDNLNVIPAKGTSPHGMHVAGIVGANCLNEEEIRTNNGIKGLAPESQLLAMKVFSNDPNGGGAYSDDIVAAIEDSVKLGADIINMSLGSTAAFQNPNDAEQKAVREATEQGVVVVVSAGNSQYSTAPYKLSWNKDTGLVGAPGLSHESIQVASFQNDYTTGPAVEYLVNGEKELTVYTVGSIDPVQALSNPEGYEVVYCEFGGTDEEFEGKDLNGKIALIKRGKYNFTLKQEMAEKYGAIGVIVFNDEARGDALINMQEAEGLSIPAIFIGNTHGNEILTSGSRVYFKEQYAVTENSNKGKMADSTSWGPTPNLDFKPQITGVGGNIWSTVTDNKYQSMSGTSMAAPYVAGAMALVLQHIDKIGMEFVSEEEKVEFAKNLVMNTATVKTEDIDGKIVPFSPRRQGAGLINTNDALENKVIATYNGKAGIALKEMGETTTFTINLKNYGDKTVTYDVESFGGVLTEQTKFYTTSMSYDVELEGAAIDFSQKTVTVTTGSSIVLDVTIEMDENTPENCFAEGFIRFIPQEENVPEIGMPFMGFYGKWDEEQIIEDPMYSDSITLYGYTTLLDKETRYLGQIGRDEYGVIVDPELFAINPISEEDTFKDVMPLLTFMRNARDIVIEIEDSENNVIRTVAMEENLRKAVLGSKSSDYRYSEDWAWDGTVYNKATGEYEVVEDGQYYVNIKSRIDFEGARYQDFRMPVKVDTVGPNAQILSGTESKDENYKLEFKLDDLTNIENYLVIVQDAFDQDDYVEIDKEQIQYDEETGVYSCDIVLPYDMSLVAVLATDYLNNIGERVQLVTNNMTEALTITSPGFNEVVKAGETLTVEYEVSEDVKDQVDNYSIEIVDLFGGFITVDYAYNVKETKYEFNNLPSGQFLVFVAAHSGDEENSTIDYDITWLYVEEEHAFVEFSNIGGGYTVATEDYRLEGKVTAIPKSLHINGEEVTVGGMFNPLSFTHTVHFESGKLNKLKIDVVDKDNNEYHYAYNVYCDTTAPVINLTQPIADEKNPNKTYYDVVVAEDAETYTIKGNVMDDMFGYKFYINGNQEINVDLSPDISGEATLREFSKEIELTEDITTVELRAVDMEVNHETTIMVNIYKGEHALPRIQIEDLNKGIQYKNGDQAKLSFKASNKGQIDRNVALIIGLFNENGEMVNVIGNEQIVRANDSIILNSIINIPSEGEYTLRCFVWDEFEAGTPVSNMIEYTIQK